MTVQRLLLRSRALNCSVHHIIRPRWAPRTAIPTYRRQFHLSAPSLAARTVKAKVVDEADGVRVFEESADGPSEFTVQSTVDDGDVEITAADEARIQAWQKEFDISDDMLAYLVTRYPGIEQDQIEKIKLGELTEQQLPKLLYPDGNIPPQVPSLEELGEEATEEEKELAKSLVEHKDNEEDREAKKIAKAMAEDERFEKMFLMGLTEAERKEFDKMMNDPELRNMLRGMNGMAEEEEEEEEEEDEDEDENDEDDSKGSGSDDRKDIAKLMGELEKELDDPKLVRQLTKLAKRDPESRADSEKLLERLKEEKRLKLQSDSLGEREGGEAATKPEIASESSSQLLDNLLARIPSRAKAEADSQPDVNLDSLMTAEMDSIPDDLKTTVLRMEREELTKKVREKRGFWNLGDPHMGADEVFQGDDISSMGHGELEQHREIREYARYAAWEMPLLTKLWKPFELPKDTQPLRFRYTTYMGEHHPAEKKVVLKFVPKDLQKLAGLTDEQITKLIKLCGARYNPETEIVKMSCESFETQAQNKRYLGDLVDKLIAEAKDTRDMFEDVPLDTRHHKKKSWFDFPENWLMTPARKQELEGKRSVLLEAEEQRRLQGRIVDGLDTIAKALGAGRNEPQPVMVGAPSRRG